jgi:uncharacterized protein YraI
MILRKLLVVPWLVLITSACGPIFSPTLPGPIFIYTNTPTPTLTPRADSITPTPSSAIAAAVTGSYFTLTIDSNCYDGPGESYNVVIRIQSGEVVQVIGRNQENTWWRIFNDLSAGCWIANEVGTFVGEVALIPITSSGLATQAWTPPPPTKEKQQDESTNPASSNPPTSNNPQPTNPPPTNPPQPTDPPQPTNPPQPTDEPPPPTQPPICLPLLC